MKNTFILPLIAVILLSCDGKPEWVKNQNVGGALGTTFSIIYIADEPLDYAKEIDSVFAAVNKSMSTYIPSSDISKINSGDTTVVVDEMFKQVFKISSKVHKVSNGFFDPTVGVLVNAWGFGPEGQQKLDSAKVDSLLHYVGWDKVKLNQNGTIKKQNPNIRFDFNAVAKGYAIDRLGELLRQKGITNYLVEVGGEILAKGKNYVPEKEWTVGIDNPTDTEVRGSAAIIHLDDRALASSGNYRKFRIDPETGEKYVHTINPKTGYPKTSNVLAANVLAPNCATADAFATAFMAMDLEDSEKLLESEKELDAFIIYLDEEGNTKTFMTEGFKAKLLD